MSEQKQAIVRFTVDMSVVMHQELVTKRRMKKAVLVRKAIELLLKDVKGNAVVQ